MNFRQVEAFRATMRTGAVTAGARLLNISQPSVSRLLADLEDALGIKLFHRHAGRLHPTPEAEIFFEEVERSFAGLDSLRLTAQRLRSLSAGRLRIATIPALSLDVVPGAGAQFIRENQGMSVSLWVRNSRQIADWVAGYQIDIGIVGSFFDQPSLTCLKKFRFRCVAVIPQGHSLESKEVLDWGDLRDEPIVSLERDFLLGERKDSGLEDLLDRQASVETEISFTACSLVRHGLGVSIVDPITAKYFEGHGLTVKRISAAIPYTFVVIHAAHKPPSLATQSYFDILIQYIENLERECVFIKKI